MALRTQISERQRRIGAEYRRLREEAGLTVKEAAERVGMGSPQLSHIEAARTSLDAGRVRALAVACGCTDAPYVDALIDMGASDGKGWWTSYKNQMPDFSLDLAEMEGVAQSVHNYETFYVPGLLQTPAYTNRVYEHRYGRTVSDPEMSLQFRHERQSVLTKDGAPDFRFVIHEAALHMRFAGAQKMREQLIHLLEMAALPNVKIQVLPSAVEESSPYPSPFLICEPGHADLATVVVDHPNRSEFLGSQAELAEYRKTFAHLSGISLPPVDASTSPRAHAARDSWGLIQHIMYQL
ncbi:helix-turn-helix transcriptional regulator [Kitasatospora sp. MAP5-34]|uniref:helix-turn-helix domain-containing protein n=1 Tax=Kitasatospora sp. MAP5-34 TaxID=3035102 RepID=UPI002473043E|nr:helix-turn-helix transcriptional regulator [Kitasatospora sp. MAP5-34]MDH6577650.1 transcriptional regulator with XRE-family HTH domain [Kitasatospora sp. MAP5-34]